MGREVSGDVVGRPARRPILSAGIALCALVVVALVVLVGAVCDPVAAATEACWVALACMVLSFCLPCVAALVVVIMRNLQVPRRARYAMATLSFAGFALLAAYPCLGVISIPGTDTARLLDLFSTDIVTRGCWVFVLLGAMMGFSLPVCDHGKPAHPRRAPRRFLVQVACGCALWACVSYQLAYSVMRANAGLLVMGPAVTFVLHSVAVPGAAFLIATLVTSVCWGFTSFGYPRWLGHALFWAPLAVLAVLLALSLGDLLELHGSMSLTFSEFRISDMGVVYTTLLGIVFGVGLSSVDD